MRTTVVATRASAVAVNVMVVETPDTSAVTVFVPADEPRVRVVWARPFVPVLTEAVDREPPPAVTANVTVTPDNPSPFWSRTSTTKGLDNSLLTTSDWLLPLIRWIDVATRAAASAVAVNVTGVVMPVAVAVTVFVPAVEPRV